MSVNLQIDKLKEQLTDIINNAHLPVGVIKFIIKDLYNEIEDIYERAVAQEKAQQSKEEVTEQDEVNEE